MKADDVLMGVIVVMFAVALFDNAKTNRRLRAMARKVSESAELIQRKEQVMNNLSLRMLDEIDESIREQAEAQNED